MMQQHLLGLVDAEIMRKASCSALCINIQSQECDPMTVLESNLLHHSDRILDHFFHTESTSIQPDNC
ncbi:hypothetical protein O6P43_010703 [Quillaja saponaria]|uniref:Uncharacterized protein n=1 Tax=Quillaja saponaria TaxID=32244 RepID=A0AAD7Q117_QUISA|nr:hypothetical protein O6P43_010703 [Quillaja saponaria]